MKNLGRKLQGFKEQHQRGNRDVIFIQETHLHPEEHEAAANQHVALWGFNYTTAHSFSFWVSGQDRRAGVAILVNPYGAVKNMQPWKEELWSEHLIMTTGELAGKKLLFINVYAPVHGAVRVQFFRKMILMDLPEEIEVICGGDFNCVTRNGLDRIGGTQRSELGATDLQTFMTKHKMWDAGYYNMPIVNGYRARMKYAEARHTHFHTAASGRTGSSRLDRFYVSTMIKAMVRGTETEEALCKSDHRAVLLELHSPKGVIRVKRRPKLYPAPSYVQAATSSLVEQKLKDLGTKLEGNPNESSIQKWETFKQDLKQEMQTLKQAARKRMTSGFRQRILRLKRLLAKPDSGHHTAGNSRTELLAALTQAQEARRVLKRRVLVTNHAWRSKASTRRFFRRVCNKFADNTIPTLVPRNADSTRDMHDKANILADSWADIFTGKAESPESIHHFIGRLNLEELDDEITEAEVAAAISRCKPGKACGPDQLGNEWYRDHAALLTPILTRLCNDCLNHGHTPSSFLEAFIYSIGKGGDSSNPLNYRPIALLNADYKIFTRILAWRVRKFVGKLVNRRQYGFVPGRTTHEVIDLLEAAKTICRENGELSEAQVLLLDFAKAYDSLDREFLLAILKAKGFPPKLCRIVRATHTNTTVQFLANGHLSDKLLVTSGIRQGCPLAPLLFIIAVDLLYDVIEHAEGSEGIQLRGALETKPLKVSGYADDTAIYITHPRLQKIAIAEVNQFSAVSGLKLNVQKSAAINLGGDENREYEEEDEMTTDSEITKTQEDGESETIIEPTDTVRYLGHIAGSGDTTTEAWEKAFSALRVSLVLAEAKTNSVQQRAAIANAIIIPKMMYVARHAWPTEDMIKRADLSIRNYVWKSKFMVPDRPPAGWIQANVAKLNPRQGGIGIPDIQVELMALSANMVGDWALAQNTQLQLIGDILQVRDTGTAKWLVPMHGTPKHGPQGTIWETVTSQQKKQTTRGPRGVSD